MTPDELRELGLYDPDAPDAEERFALLQLTLEHGVALDAIREAIAENRLHALAAVWVVEGDHSRARSLALDAQQTFAQLKRKDDAARAERWLQMHSK